MQEFQTMEEHLQLWYQACLQPQTVDRYIVDKHQELRLPTNGFIWCMNDIELLEMGGNLYKQPANWLVHGGAGTSVRLKAKDGVGTFYMLLYHAELPTSTPFMSTQQALNNPLSPFIAIEVAGDSLLMKQLHQFVQLWSPNNITMQWQAKSQFLLFIHQWIIEQYQSSSSSRKERISELITYMQNHLDQRITLGQLADLANYSVPHLCDLFKEETGFTPIEYLIRLRIEAAKELLSKSSLSIPAIAEQIGYRDSYYFGRLFKQATCLTPNQYRKAAHQRIPSNRKIATALPDSINNLQKIKPPQKEPKHDQMLQISHALGKTELTNVPTRIVALDWTMAEYLLALGITPVGVISPSEMRKWLLLPVEIPESILDIGPRVFPHLDVIATLKPDLIIGTHVLTEPLYEQLCLIAPTVAYDIFPAPLGTTEYGALEQSFMHLAAMLGKSAEAATILGDLAGLFTQLRSRILSTNLSTDRVIIAFGYTYKQTVKLRLSCDGSLAVGVLERLGLRNGFRAGNYDSRGFLTVDLADLVSLAESEHVHVLYIVPSDDTNARTQLQRNSHWQELLPPSHQTANHASIWPYGGPLSTRVLAQAVVTAMEQFTYKQTASM